MADVKYVVIYFSTVAGNTKALGSSEWLQSRVPGLGFLFSAVLLSEDGPGLASENRGARRGKVSAED